MQILAKLLKIVACDLKEITPVWPISKNTSCNLKETKLVPVPKWEQIWKSQKECLYFISLKAYSLVNAKPLDPDARHDNKHFVKKKYT